MKNNRFWNWVCNEETGASEMYLYGAIAESTWFEDDVTPAMFRSELQKHSGDVTVFMCLLPVRSIPCSETIRARSRSRSTALPLLRLLWWRWQAM